MLDAFEAGKKMTPRWTYARVDHAHLRRALDGAAHWLDQRTHPIAELYAARARELEIEAALVSATGTTAFGALARARFCSAVARDATILARQWITDGCRASPAHSHAEIESDAPTAESLLSRMRQEVSLRGLPFAVIVQPSLSALAATGDRHIFIAPARRITKEDVERTVLHEILAHAIPRTRAMQERHLIFQIGTARGVDHQEGLALVLEERHGFLTPRRKSELAVRHFAVLAMDDGAEFHDTVKALVNEHGQVPYQAILTAERAFRGGDGISPGLGRERIYLESFVDVHNHLAKHPTDEAILMSGQVSVDAIATLAPLLTFPLQDRAWEGT
ncbi:MAG: flavohemoglobin expression-modulating QEGLA motif protein [Polyangiaceae bacterium]|nr:flavohemoglobin expression-modulating QEGLA motif protein [Polyangiaceae bacterium]